MHSHGKAGTQQRTLRASGTKGTIPLESHPPYAVGTCLGAFPRPGGGGEGTGGAALICLPSAYQGRLHETELLQTAHSGGACVWDSRAETRSLHQNLETEADKAPGVKMFINTWGPKGKEPATQEPAGEDDAFSLFSWCE